VEIVYSINCSDDEELLDSCAAKCLLLQELPMRGYQVHPVDADRNIFREHHHLYEKLKLSESILEYLRMKIETFDYILNLTSGKMQKKQKNCHGNPITEEEQLELVLRFVEVVFVPMCSNIYSS
jgi:hypothetical protein